MSGFTEMNKDIKVLVMGPRLNARQGAGGAVVLFENLLDELQAHNISHTIIDTNKSNHQSKGLFVFNIISRFISLRRRHDVIFLNSSRDYLYLLPLMFFFNTIGTKKIVLRKFGGELDQDLKKKTKGAIIKRLLSKLDMVFVESKLLLGQLKAINPNTYWFPNVRERNASVSVVADYQKRFVFISHIKESKGVKELLEAFKQLDSSYSLHFYGTLVEQELSALIADTPNTAYKGHIAPEQVYQTICEYDVVVLPTHYPGEGYPGILIEAYACAKPVISTYWKQIPEIVNDGVTGYLVTPGNAEELINAIKNIETNYATLSVNALNKFDEFDSKLVSDKIFNLLLN